MFDNFRVKPNDRILDVGCGDGGFTAWLAQQAPEGYVLGIDRIPEFIQKNIETYPQKDFPSIHFRVADALTLDFPAEPFDMVVSKSCLHFFAHPGMAFEAMARHLKPHGLMYVQCLGKGNLQRLRKTLDAVVQRPAWQPYFSGYDAPWGLVDGQSCVPWLEKAGLRKKKAGLVNDQITFPDKLALSNWIYPNWTPYFDRLPQTAQVQFMQEIVDHYCGSKKGPIQVQRVWLYLEAEKL